MPEKNKYLLLYTSAGYDIVNWKMDQFYNISEKTEDEQPSKMSLYESLCFALVGCAAVADIVLKISIKSLSNYHWRELVYGAFRYRHSWGIFPPIFYFFNSGEYFRNTSGNKNCTALVGQFLREKQFHTTRSHM